MSRFAIPIPNLEGPLSAHVGATVQFSTLFEPVRGIRFDLNLSSADTTGTDTVITITDGTEGGTITIPAGDRYKFELATALNFPAFAELTLTVLSAGDAEGLSGVFQAQTTSNANILGSGWVTSNDVIAALGLSSLTTEETTYLNRMIDLVTERGRLYTGRVLNRASWVETFYYPNAVTLREYPVVSIDAVERDGTTITPANIKANLERGRVWQDSSPARDWAGTNALTVTYTAGYDPIPVGVQEWCFQAIAKRWNAYQSDGVGLEVSMTPRKVVYPDAGSVDFGDAGSLSASFDSVLGVPMSALDPYRDLSHGMSSEYSAWVVAP